MLGNSAEIVKRGEMITSLSSLASRWGWSRNKTRSFIECLEASGMIEQKKDSLKDRRWTRLNIVNYSGFQAHEEKEGQVNGQEKDRLQTGFGQVSDTNNNDNKYNNNIYKQNNIIDSSNKGSKKKSEACDAIKMMRQEYEQRVKPKYSVWEEHQCSGTLDRLREEYDGVFDERYVWMADQP